MELQNFIENYIDDYMTFGEDTKYIYEEIFSTVFEKKLDFSTLDKLINEEIDVISEAPFADQRIADSVFKKIVADNNLKLIGNQTGNALNPVQQFAAAMKNKEIATNIGKFEIGNLSGNALSAVEQAAKAAEHAVANGQALTGTGRLAQEIVANQNNVGFFGKLINGLKNATLKVKDFFGKLKGKSFTEIMNNGVAWIQANPVMAISSVGGIVMLALIIKALRKRKRLNKYKKLEQLYNQSLQQNPFKNDLVKEDLQKDAVVKIFNECKHNYKLDNLITGGKNNLFKY